MKALIDGDILRYEIGFAAEAGWRAITESDDIPPWYYVEDILEQRIAHIQAVTESDDYTLYLTKGRTFRYDVAKTKPYKGTRKDNKPWHFDNLTAHMESLPHETVTEIEADDAMAIASTADPTNTVICSRDKDLRQVPGNFFSWELGKQPSFGPLHIDPVGSIQLSDSRKEIKGTGFAWFCSQLLVGDRVDNIPGLEGCGPVRAYELLEPVLIGEEDGYEWYKENLLYAVEREYKEKYGNQWEDVLLEQGRLLWIIRRYNEDGTPELWNLELYE